MDDNEFRETVLAALRHLEAGQAKASTQLSAVDARLGHFEARLSHFEAGQAKAANQLSAIVARLDEHELLFDRVFHKLDRLTTHVSTSAEASEQALNSITTLTRRVIKLEFPDDNTRNLPPQG